MRRTAVILTALAALGSACTAEVATPDPGVTTSPTPAATPTPTASTSTTSSSPSPAGLRDLGLPVVLGPGSVVASTPDGASVYVLSPDPDDDALGCEGSPFNVLWIVDPLTGERRRALDVTTEDHPFVSMLLLDGAPSGRIALVGNCEGFLGQVLVGSVDPGGSITDVVEVTMPPVELASWSLRWVPGSNDFSAVGLSGSDTSGLYLIDATSGEWIDVDERPLENWFSLGGGLAVEILDREVRLVDGDGSEVTAFPGDEFVPSPSGLPALVFRYGGGDGVPGEVSLLMPGGTRRVLEEFEGFAGSFSADGSIVAWASSDPATFDVALVLHDVATGRRTVVDDSWFAGVTFVATGIVYTGEGPDQDAEFGDAVVRFRPWIE